MYLQRLYFCLTSFMTGYVTGVCVCGCVCSDCNIVGKVNGVCFTFSKEGRPSGEAFVELMTAEDFKNAISKDRKYMGHRYIEGG